MRLPPLLLPVIPLLLAIPPALAGEPAWVLDTVHSRVLVAVDHAGFSQSLAILPVSAGQLHYDPEHPERARVEVSFEPARLDFGNARWNAAVHGSGLLDVQRHRQARFFSTRVTRNADDSLQVEGMLELRGISAPVVLQARRNGLRRHPLPPFRPTVGFSATAGLSRSAYGVSAWPALVGDVVSLRIEIEAARQRGASAGSEERDTEAGTAVTDEALSPAATSDAPPRP